MKNKNSRINPFAACFIALILAGCGGGGGSSVSNSGAAGNGSNPLDVQPLPPDGPAALNAYFPTTAGSRWYYQHTNNQGGNGQAAVEVSGLATVAGRVLTVMTATDIVDSTTSVSYFSTTADGVREYSGPNSNAAGTGLESYVMLRLPASTPAPYLQYDVDVANPPDVDGDGHPDALHLRAVVTTMPAGALVQTLAGQFNDCVQQHTVGTATVVLSSTGATVVVNQVGDDWYARGIGLVKSVSTYTGNGKTLSDQFVLTGYGVGGVRSESVAPTVTIPPSPPQAVRGVGLDVAVHFSEPMYPPSVMNGAVALLDPQGQIVPGAVYMSGNDAHFQPNAALASGTYMLSVDTRAQDLVGNALATAVSWPVLIDSEGPGVLSISPADGATGVRPDVQIVVTLSEPLAPYTSGNGLVQLLDAQGVAVAWDPLVNGATLTLLPSPRLQAGATYTVVVSPNLTDPLGNVSGVTVRTQFTVNPDGTGPRLVQVFPADGSVDVAPDTVLRLTFDEPVDPSTVSAITFTINGTYSVADYFPSVAGAVVSFTPRNPMAQDAMVQINVGPLNDLLGNTNKVPFTSSFSTIRSRFDPVTSLTLDAWVGAVALGDLNGDGRIDQVLATGSAKGFFGLDVYQLQVRLGIPGGGRGASVVLPLPGNQCGFTQVQIVDLDSDGRPDVLISSPYCGLWVYYQQADGSLAAPQNISGMNFQQVRAVDMNGDGRPDLVGVSGNQLSIWFNDGSGGWAAGPTATLAAAGARNFSVGDVNGDGRPDIVVALDNGPLGPHVAVYRQNAGGTLDPAQTFNAASNVAWDVAVGDVTGDGRADIVATIGGNRPSAALEVWPQQPDGSLGAPQILPIYEIPRALKLADVDGDGRLDVVVSHDGWFRIGVLLQGPAGLGGELLYPADTNAGDSSNLAVGDLNGDGLADIVLGDQFLAQRAPVPALALDRTIRPGIKKQQISPVVRSKTLPWMRMLQRLTIAPPAAPIL